MAALSGISVLSDGWQHSGSGWLIGWRRAQPAPRAEDVEDTADRLSLQAGYDASAEGAHAAYEKLSTTAKGTVKQKQHTRRR